MAALGDLVTPLGESLDTNGITQLMNTLILPGREMFELVHNHSDHSSGFRHARRHLSRRRLFWGLGRAVVYTATTAYNAGTTAVNAAYNAGVKAVCSVVDELRDSIEEALDWIVNKLSNQLIAPLVNFGCNVVQNFVLESLQKIGEICLVPEGADESCAAGSVFAMREIEPLGITRNGEKVLKVSAGVNFNACMQIVKTEIDCSGLSQFIKTTAANWLNTQVVDPILGFVDEVQTKVKEGIGCRRRLAEVETARTVLHEIAVTALRNVSGDGHRRLHEAHKDATLHSTLMVDALQRGEQIIREKLADAAVARFKDIGRRRMTEQAGYLEIGKIVTKFTLEASVAIKAEAALAMEEHRQLDLMEHLLGEKVRFSQTLPLSVVPLLLGFGLTSTFEMGLPLEMRASFQGQAVVEGRVGYHRSWTITMDGRGSSVAERSEAGDGVTLAAQGAVSASLSVSVGAYVYINFLLEAYIAVVVVVSGEAGVRWEAKVGADLAVCGAATTSGLTGLCENLNTQLTPYIEYEPDQVALAQTQGSGYSIYAQIGVWAYVPYPHVKVGIGITLPGSESPAACLGVPTGIDWSSNFGSPDDQIGNAHPFGHFIVRRAIAKTLAFSNDNTAIQPLGPEFEYASPPIAPSKCRFEFTQSRGGTARSQWQLSEIRLYESSGSQLSVTDCVSNVGGDKNAQEGSLKLIDGRTNTKNCCSTSSTNVVVTLTLSPSITSAVASYKLYTANDMPSRDPISWTFSCEHGDGVYKVLDQQTGVSAPNGRKTAYPTYNL